jgi:DNA-binding response OmpR family regulator
MGQANILILEDDKDILEVIRFNLEQEDYKVFTAVNGMEALSILRDEIIDLAILDIMVPEMSGTELCRIIRKEERLKDLPILFLSAKTEEADRLVGFMVGGDDYINKPFSLKELIARVNALLRRSKFGNEQYLFGSLEVYFNRHLVKIQGKRIKFTPKEFNVLNVLIQRQTKTISREFLLEHVWGMESNSSARSVDIVITRIREKLKEYGRCIRTVIGFGYQWDEEIYQEAQAG